MFPSGSFTNNPHRQSDDQEMTDDEADANSSAAQQQHHAQNMQRDTSGAQEQPGERPSSFQAVQREPPILPPLRLTPRPATPEPSRAQPHPQPPPPTRFPAEAVVARDDVTTQGVEQVCASPKTA